MIGDSYDAVAFRHGQTIASDRWGFSPHYWRVLSGAPLEPLRGNSDTPPAGLCPRVNARLTNHQSLLTNHRSPEAISQLYSRMASPPPRRPVREPVFYADSSDLYPIEQRASVETNANVRIAPKRWTRMGAEEEG